MQEPLNTDSIHGRGVHPDVRAGDTANNAARGPRIDHDAAAGVDASHAGREGPWDVLPGGDHAQVSFYDLARAVAKQLEAEERAAGRGANAARRSRRLWAVRALLIDAGGGAWAPFATVLRPPRDDLYGDDLLWGDELGCDVRLGAVRLLSREVTYADFRDSASAAGVETEQTAAGIAATPDTGTSDPGAILRRLLLTAAETVRDSGALDPAPRGLVAVRRWNGRNRWLQEPCWVATWSVQVPPPAAPPQMPYGRLFSAELHLFYEGTPEAAAGWCRDDTFTQKHTTEPVYAVVIPDDRAYFADVRRTDTGIEVAVGGLTDAPLYCVAVVESGDTQWTEVADVETARPRPETARDATRPARVATIRSGAPARLTLTLFGEDSTEFDHAVLAGPAFAAAPGESLFDTYAAFMRERSRPFDEARRVGEGERVEFKAWVPPERKRGDDKVRELLETGVAFANARGGSIFIGVDDYGEVVGVRGNVDAVFGEVGREDQPGQQIAKRRAAYVQAVRKLLVDGVAPTLAPEFRWHDVAGLSVLQVDIAQGAQRPYMLVENRAIYVRRGSTNTKPDTPELVALAGAAGGRGRLLGG